MSWYVTALRQRERLYCHQVLLGERHPAVSDVAASRKFATTRWEVHLQFRGPLLSVRMKGMGTSLGSSFGHYLQNWMCPLS